MTTIVVCSQKPSIDCYDPNSDSCAYTAIVSYISNHAMCQDTLLNTYIEDHKNMAT